MPETIILKTCRTCKKTKPISEFYKWADSHDGYKNVCKVCCAKRQKKYLQTEQGKASQKRYKQTEKGKAANRKGGARYRKTEKGRATSRERVARYQKTEKYKVNRKRFHIRHPERDKATHAVNHAISAVKLPRPDSMRCSHCPAQAKQYHHHKGYEPEHWLDVIPVCEKCHYFLSRL